MTETRFTPGPWSIVPYGEGSSLVIHSDGDNRVCFMATASSDRLSSHAAIRANAHLIAAAPQMFEALTAVKGVLDDYADEATPASEPLTEAEHMVLACRTIIWAALQAASPSSAKGDSDDA